MMHDYDGESEEALREREWFEERERQRYEDAAREQAEWEQLQFEREQAEVEGGEGAA